MLKFFAALSFLVSFHATSPHVHVTKAQFSQATRVAVCEEGGWHNAHGPEYFGALGWLNATWQEFKLPWMPHLMSDATPMDQAWALQQFAKKYGMPDLHGCHGY